MYKIKVLLATSMLLVISGCSLMPTFGKKKDKNKEEESTQETIETFDGDMFAEESPETLETSDTNNSTQDILMDSDLETVALDDDWFIETTNQDTSLIWEDPALNISDDHLSTYSSVASDQQDEITKLKSEIKLLTDELYKLKAKSQIWENPFSIYNKEIILNNGSTVYGKITYQDQEILYVETLIGGLTLQRKNVKRVIENITQIADSSDYYNDQTRRDEILEIKKEEDGTIFEPSTKLLANAILLGDITEEVDFRGNRILTGDIKNIGEARADFVKINFIFRMNWQGKTKALTAFVRGSKHVFPDSNIESDSSVELGAIAGFELVIPPDFGNFIGYSYTIDWEQYDE